MKKQPSQIEAQRSTKRQTGQPRQSVRQKAKGISPTIRLLKDVAAEQEQAVHARREMIDYIERHGSQEDLRALVSTLTIVWNQIRLAKDPQSAWVVSEAESLFIAEAIRHAKKLIRDGDDVNAYLLGFMGVMHPSHPARDGVTRVYLHPEDRAARFEELQLGNYECAAA